MADGKLFRLVLVMLVVHAAAAFVASCVRREPPTDWGALSQGVKKVQGR